MSKEPIPDSTAGRDALMARVAEDLRRAIKAQGVKQKAIASRLGVAESEVSGRLSGQRNLTLASINELAGLAGLSVSVTFSPQAAN
jgi:transcriptional regulator with XRE-family HTH domain